MIQRHVMYYTVVLGLYGSDAWCHDTVKLVYETVTLVHDTVTLVYDTVTLVYDTVTLVYGTVRLLYDTPTIRSLECLASALSI